jgi:hypothetical protein
MNGSTGYCSVISVPVGLGAGGLHIRAWLGSSCVLLLIFGAGGVVGRGTGCGLQEGACLSVFCSEEYVPGVPGVRGRADARCVSRLTHLSLSLSLLRLGSSR